MRQLYACSGAKRCKDMRAVNVRGPGEEAEQALEEAEELLKHIPSDPPPGYPDGETEEEEDSE